MAAVGRIASTTTLAAMTTASRIATRPLLRMTVLLFYDNREIHIRVAGSAEDRTWDLVCAGLFWCERDVHEFAGLYRGLGYPEVIALQPMHAAAGRQVEGGGFAERHGDGRRRELPVRRDDVDRGMRRRVNGSGADGSRNR